MKRISTLFFLSLAFAAQGVAQKMSLSINSGSGVYAKGEQATITCRTDVPLRDSLSVAVSHNDRVVRRFTVMPQGTEFTIMQQALDSTCAVSVEVKATKELSRSIGYVVAPEGFKPGYEEPADLMQYWDNLKKQLRALPMQVKTSPLQVPDQYQGKYQCYDLEINCLGPAPVRAYVAKPLKAKKKSLPIVIQCRAAGVAGDWCRCQVGQCVGNAALGNGALSLDINAHGMVNGQDDEFYKMLENGVLDHYYDHIADRETYYFRGMYLRLLRAIEYMTRMPEWDGKRILVMGESQGGGQAAAAAGLDNRVTAAVLIVPAMQDLGGALKGRRSGWPQPIENHWRMDRDRLRDILPYFDASLLLRHSRAQIHCEMGLIDTTCPPSSVWSSMNGAPGEKTVMCVPFRTHAWPDGDLRPIWDQKYYFPRQDFIQKYLE